MQTIDLFESDIEGEGKIAGSVDLVSVENHRGEGFRAGEGEYDDEEGYKYQNN